MAFHEQNQVYIAINSVQGLSRIPPFTHIYWERICDVHFTITTYQQKQINNYE